MGTGDEEYDYLFKGKCHIIFIKQFIEIFDYLVFCFVV